MNVIPVSRAKAHLNELVTSVATSHQPITITQNGQPAAVLVSPDDLEAIWETASWLADPATLPEVREAERDIAEQRTLSVEDYLALVFTS